MNSEVDIVILWVDPSDPEWQKKYADYTGQSLQTINNSSRFRDWDTLKYLMRSIQFNMPWINNIHLVTDKHVPKWLNLNAERLIHHNHEDVFLYKDALPSFNSSAIEMNLGNIPGLSEKFLYSNDDCLVLFETDESRFFINDLPVDFLKLDWPRDFNIIRWKHRHSEWQTMVLNSLNMIKSKFKKIDVELTDHREFKQVVLKKIMPFRAIEHYHHIQPYRKDHILSIYDEYPDEIKKTIFSKLRKHSNLSQLIFRYNHLFSGNFHSKSHSDSKVITLKNLKQVKNIELGQHNIICLNDGFIGDDIEFEKAKICLSNKLEHYLPFKSVFEV